MDEEIVFYRVQRLAYDDCRTDDLNDHLRYALSMSKTIRAGEMKRQMQETGWNEPLVDCQFIQKHYDNVGYFIAFEYRVSVVNLLKIQLFGHKSDFEIESTKFFVYHKDKNGEVKDITNLTNFV